MNAVMDAAYRSATTRPRDPVQLFEWRGGFTARIAKTPETFEGQTVIKRKVLPDGRQKLILKDPVSGDFSDRVVAANEWRRSPGSCLGPAAVADGRR